VRRGWLLGAAVVALYLGGYLVYRVTHVQVWQADDRAYVMFGSRVAWYLLRPVSRLDAAVTGMRFHLGAHRPPPETARQLVDRAILAAGGAERLVALKAFEWRGRAEAAIGGRAPVHLSGTWRLQPPDSAIVTTTLEGQPRGTARSLIISGNRGWSRTGRKLTPLGPALVAHERDQFYLYHLMRLVPLRGSAYRLSPPATDSLGHKRIRVSHPGRPSVDLAFDAAANLTGLTDSVTDPQSHRAVRQDVRLTGQLSVAGVRWPRRIAITWDGKPYFDLEILDVRPLAGLVDPSLGGPAPAAPRRAGKRSPTSGARKH
jgi:hypothetical protein